ncbi:unnamed protein product [Ambrosiozyma monospora]|uniref:Unnamed protein product n=1 Tax=Ambrosiozyma monospora TaxID=43982 RepID=A0ACB5SSZ3_AMBMO|nr:unnamed protein product [Ambrosiozyma monospora]
MSLNLFALGNTQHESTYDETCSPTMSYEVLRIVLAEAIEDVPVGTKIVTRRYVLLVNNWTVLNLKGYGNVWGRYRHVSIEGK